MIKRDDFAFIYQAKIVNELMAEDVHYLLPIDQQNTPHHAHALLLLHGFASSPAVYRAILPLCQGYDRIVCPVLPGHGESITAFANASAQDWFDTAYAYCASLTASYQRVSVVGLSLGALLALHLCQHFPLHHLYLLAPACKLPYSVRLSLIAAKLLRFLGCQSLANRSGHLYHSPYQELSYRRLPLNAIINMLTVISAFRAVEIRCPTELFLGCHDRVIDSQAIASFFAQNPAVHLHWLEHSGHILPLDGDRAAIVAAINKGAQ